VSITNNGELGADTYDLTLSSAWSASLYAADGVTLLTDTDHDGTVDTGLVPQGSSVTITIKVQTPGGAAVGNSNTAALTARSSLDTGKSKTTNLVTAVPAPFIQGFEDNADGAMSIDLVQPHNQTTQQATDTDYYGYDLAIIRATGGNYFYAWSKGYSTTHYYNNIEFTLLDHSGATVHPVTQLTDNSGSTNETDDRYPAAAVTPDGRIGVLWTRVIYNSDGSQFNYNVYFAILDSTGAVVSGPTNITNNSVWGAWGDLNVPQYNQTQISASGDDHFTLAWEKDYNGSGGWVSQIQYAVRDSNGNSIKAVTQLPISGLYVFGSANPVSGNRTIFTWMKNWNVYYAVLDSAGNVVKAETSLTSSGQETNSFDSDAVQLSDGRIAIAWTNYDGSIPGKDQLAFAILDNSYILASGPTALNNPAAPSNNDYVSITADTNGHAILSWTDSYDSPHNLYYALVGSNGSVLTAPMIFRSTLGDTSDIYTGQTGYGNTPYVVGEFGKTSPAANAYEAANGLTLQWGSSSDAVRYEYCYDTTNDNACDGSWINNGTATSAAISGLNVSTTYYWQVRAINGDGETAYADGGVGPGTWWTLKTSLFADVPEVGKEWMRPWIEGFYNAGITTGCGTGPLIYCPDRSVTRAEMAVFLERATHYPSLPYTPPAASHFFSDMPVTSKEWMEAWVDQFYRDGITTGCGTGPLIYCPERAVTRAEMAVFILRAEHGSGYIPPTASGYFSDVPVTGKEWMEPWIDQFYREGITTGCGTGPLVYCPEREVTRAEMAVFVSRAFSIPQTP
jgi:hypothetical protein